MVLVLRLWRSWSFWISEDDHSLRDQSPSVINSSNQSLRDQSFRLIRRIDHRRWLIAQQLIWRSQIDHAVTDCAAIDLTKSDWSERLIAQQFRFGLNIGIPKPAPRRIISNPKISNAKRIVFSRLKNGYLLKYILILERRTSRGEVPIPNKNIKSPEYRALW